MKVPYDSQLAMCLIPYKRSDGETVTVWNSIDRNPDNTICLSSMEVGSIFITRDEDAEVTYAPDHLPELDELVIIEHTLDVARYTACAEWDRTPAENRPENYSRQEFIDDHLAMMERAGFPTYCIPATEKLCEFFRNLPR